MVLAEAGDEPVPVSLETFTDADRRRLLRQLSRRARRHGVDAEDVTQDALLAGWEHREQLRCPAALMSWLTTMGLRRSSLLAARAGRVSAEPLDETDQRLPAGGDPLEVLLDGEERERINAALAVLRPLDRDLLEGSINGASAETLAALFDLTVGGMRTRLWRARRTFDREYRSRFGLAAPALLLGERMARNLSRHGRSWWTTAPVQGLLAGATALSISMTVTTVPFALRSPGPVRSDSSILRRPGQPVVVAVPAVQRPGPQSSQRFPPEHAGPGGSEPGGASGLPVPVPTATPDTGVCTGQACVGEPTGATVYLKETLPIVGEVKYWQNIANPCPWVAENPLVGCDADDGDYMVDLPPPPKEGSVR